MNTSKKMVSGLTILLILAFGAGFVAAREQAGLTEDFPVTFIDQAEIVAEPVEESPATPVDQIEIIVEPVEESPATPDIQVEEVEIASMQEGTTAEPAGEAVAVVETEVAEIAEPDEAGTFPFLKHKSDISEFLSMLGKASEKNIILSPQVRGPISVDLYDVTFKEALDAVLSVNGFAYEEKGSFIFVYAQKEFDALQAAARKMETAVYRLNYIPAKDVEELIKPLVSSSGMVTTSPEAGDPKIEAGENWAVSNYIIVRDFPEQLEQIAQLIKDIDQRPPQVLVEATILVASLDDTNKLGIDLSYLGGANTEFYNGGDLIIDSSAATNGGATSEFTASANVGTGGLSIGITNNNIGVLIRALESITDVVTLGNPKIMTLNRQQGKVLVGNRDGYITTEVSATTATQTVNFLETGTELTFRPFVMQDGYIRMELNPSDSSGGVEVTGNFTLPSETTAEVQTNVLVRDGQTIIVGGLFRDKTTIGRSQIPLLGNLPGLGTLFRSTSDVVEKEEVIFLITPHIVKEEVDYALAREVRDNCDVLMAGMYDGLQWHGREKIAGAHYHWAREHLSAGELDKALWDANMAAYTTPGYLDALKLRDELRTEKMYVGRKTSMRSFMRDLLERESR